MPNWLKLEDIVKIVGLAITLLPLCLGWRKERSFARRQQADQIRFAAAKLISNLERWREITLSIFEEVQACFVETSQIAARNPDRLDFTAARDFQWKEISRIRAAVRRQLVSENIQSSHAGLIAYCPGARMQFVVVFEKLGTIEQENFEHLLLATQQVVEDFKKSAAPYSTARLGNALRDRAFDVRRTCVAELDPVMQEAIEILNTMIHRKDEDLIFDRRGLTGSSSPNESDVASPKPAVAA